MSYADLVLDDDGFDQDGFCWLLPGATGWGPQLPGEAQMADEMAVWTRLKASEVPGLTFHGYWYEDAWHGL